MKAPATRVTEPSSCPRPTAVTFTVVPVFHECQRCTACCRWPGQVRVTEAEVAPLAGLLGLTAHDFIQRHTCLRADRGGLALAIRPNGECIFLEGARCAVQTVKPQQCRDFPNLWNFPGFEIFCRSIPRRVDADEWRRLVAIATQRAAETLTPPLD